MKAKVIQEVEDAMVDAVMDSAASLGLTPLQRAKFIVAISETLIDAVSPYVQQADVAEPKASKAPRPPRKRRSKAEIAAAAAQQTLPLVPPPIPAPTPTPTPDTTQPAPFKGPPAVAQPFAVS